MLKKVWKQTIWKTHWKRSDELCRVFKRKNRRSGTHLRFVLKDFFRTCIVLPFSCTHLAFLRGKEEGLKLYVIAAWVVKFFQMGDTKLEIFLLKNQHTQRKVLNFESKSANIWLSWSIFYVKNHPNLFQIFFIK